jgi:hypothetical protein
MRHIDGDGEADTLISSPSGNDRRIDPNQISVHVN